MPAAPSPLARVEAWYREAVAAGLPEPDAMALATADAAGRPSVRFVLLKGVAFWGGLMFAFMTVLMLLQLGAAHPRLPLVLAIAVPLCAFGGLCWGLLTWIFNERIHRAITDKNEIA